MMKSAADLSFIYVTFPDRETASRIGRAAVEKQLCACINIFGPHESIYRWNGKIETSVEVAAIFKTKSSSIPGLTSFIESEHPFETPCLAVLNPTQINESFEAWLRGET